ncbi:hypothetical protein NDU88_009382 [Pleurodeles waltl]|uniref:Uncharacterized protein n=1 Tax=Pleurodeles waltl TaxID=8319 RepID=A0AAV7RZJ7_PLEWA|nr:hypothetical protein NDU88_009382 [Pleurodeles waltl]
MWPYYPEAKDTERVLECDTCDPLAWISLAHRASPGSGWDSEEGLDDLSDARTESDNPEFPGDSRSERGVTRAPETQENELSRDNDVPPSTQTTQELVTCDGIT